MGAGRHSGKWIIFVKQVTFFSLNHVCPNGVAATVLKILESSQGPKYPQVLLQPAYTSLVGACGILWVFVATELQPLMRSKRGKHF